MLLGNMRGSIILGLIFIVLISLPFWVNTDINTTPGQDKIVVGCAEFGLWRVMASDDMGEFFELLEEPNLFSTISIEDLDFRLLLVLEADGIALSANQDPWGKHADYIAFKADYYRDMFGWGSLPPPDIIRKCGVIPFPTSREQAVNLNSSFTLAGGTPFNKIDNPAAVNVSYAHLSCFLEGLNFIDMPTSDGCGWYAQEVHNRAEANGIRAAIVVARVGEGYHAFNAFETTDNDMIYASSINGKCLIAKETDGIYWVEIRNGNQRQAQELGNHTTFNIFW